MDKNKFCIECGFELLRTAEFCEECGAKLIVSETTKPETVVELEEIEERPSYLKKRQKAPKGKNSQTYGIIVIVICITLVAWLLLTNVKLLNMESYMY